MSKTLKTGVLRGRPFGGIMILIKKKLRNITETIFCSIGSIETVRSTGRHPHPVRVTAAVFYQEDRDLRRGQQPGLLRLASREPYGTVQRGGLSPDLRGDRRSLTDVRGRVDGGDARTPALQQLPHRLVRRDVLPRRLP